MSKKQPEQPILYSAAAGERGDVRFAFGPINDSASYTCLIDKRGEEVIAVEADHQTRVLYDWQLNGPRKSCRGADYDRETTPYFDHMGDAIDWLLGGRIVRLK